LAVPRQNRVTPFGDIVVTPERGTFMGNRGILHNAEGQVKRAWQVKRWLVCVLEFRGRKREVMTPNRYTELFFLDEATALAAGHRPCAECRHAAFLAFCNAWKVAHPSADGSQRPSADDIDNRLHRERVTPDRSKRLFRDNLEELPNGVFVRHADWGEYAYLVWNHGLLAWTAGGYTERRDRPKRAKVLVLTPESTVAAIRAGYTPVIHPSASLLTPSPRSRS
jgi:hypothetical protein